MADNEVKIKVSTETETAPLEEMDDLVEDIQANANVKVDVDDSSVEEATDKTEDLSDKLDDVDSTTANPEVDADSADEAMDKFDEMLEVMEEINSKIVKPEVDSSGLDEANEKLEQTDSTISNLITTMAGLVAVKEIEEMATIADNINNSWNRVNLTFEGTGTTVDALRDKVAEVSAETGRSGGAIRDYFNQMGIAGVTNADILGQSFESLSGFAYQADKSVEEMEGKLQRLVMTGTVSDRMLISLGLTAEELAASMGVSADQISEAFENMTPEERLQAITTAMGDGATANQMYGDSYEGMKAKAEMAMSGLKGAVGQSILPVLIPALDMSTQMVNGMKTAFQNLPGPVQSAIGTVAGIGSVTVTAIGVLGEFGSSIAGISDGVKAVTESKKLAAAAQWLWNAAMSANPIGILIIAIAALIAILAYLYFNNEQVRAAIDGLGQSVVGVGQMIWGAIMDVYNQAVLYYENFLTMIDELQTYLVDCVNNFVDTLLGFGAFLVELGQQIYTTVINAAMMVMQGILNFLAWYVTLPIQIATVLTNIITQVISFASNFVSKFGTAGTSAVSKFISNISQIPGKLAAELGNALNKVNEWAATLPAKFWEAGVNAVKNFLNALGIHSPGIIQTSLVGEVSDMGERIPEAAKGVIRNVGRMGSDIVDAFGNPVLNTEFANGQIVGVSGSINTTGVTGDTIINVYGDVDNEKRVQEIVDAVRKEISWNNITAGRTI